MANKKIFWGMLAMALAFGMAAVGCDDGSKDPGNGSENEGNVLPASVGANDLSGKTYVDRNEKIEFSITAEGATSGTYTKKSTYEDEDEEGQTALDENGKYKYTNIETGFYSWNETAKTVTVSPEKAALYDEGEYGPLKTKAEYRTLVQTKLNQMKADMGEAALIAILQQEEGFSSIAAFLDYTVAKAFGNITNNYAFSVDAKALFLDEVLPANKGTNELTGETYTRSGQTYVFTDDDCTYDEKTYSYGYDSTTKIVYLKVSTANRESTYTQATDNPSNSDYFTDVDEYKAAMVNNQYNRIEKYKYNTTTKELQDNH